MVYCADVATVYVTWSDRMGLIAFQLFKAHNTPYEWPVEVILLHDKTSHCRITCPNFRVIPITVMKLQACKAVQLKSL